MHKFSDLYRPPNFEKDAQPLEKVKFYFRRFFINSLNIDFSMKIEVKNAKIAHIFITSLSSFLSSLLGHIANNLTVVI